MIPRRGGGRQTADLVRLTPDRSCRAVELAVSLSAAGDGRDFAFGLGLGVEVNQGWSGGVTKQG